MRISLKKILNPLTLCQGGIRKRNHGSYCAWRINQCSTSSYCDGACYNVDLDLDDFTRIGKRVPVVADIKPFGENYMSSLNEVGGIQPLMKMLLDADLLHGDCLTVSGKTISENLSEVDPYRIIRQLLEIYLIH